MLFLLEGTTRRPILLAADAYNQNLAKITPTNLSKARYLLSAASSGDSAIFAGGSNSDGLLPTVETYNSNLIRTILTDFNEAKYNLAATEFGNYALFGGGFSSSGYLKTVEIFNAVADFVVYKGSKYKFQNMTEEETVTADMETISIPTPATGYIKFKNTTI